MWISSSARPSMAAWPKRSLGWSGSGQRSTWAAKRWNSRITPRPRRATRLGRQRVADAPARHAGVRQHRTGWPRPDRQQQGGRRGHGRSAPAGAGPPRLRRSRRPAPSPARGQSSPRSVHPSPGPAEGAGGRAGPDPAACAGSRRARSAGRAANRAARPTADGRRETPGPRAQRRPAATRTQPGGHGQTLQRRTTPSSSDPIRPGVRPSLAAHVAINTSPRAWRRQGPGSRRSNGGRAGSTGPLAPPPGISVRRGRCRTIAWTC